LIFKAKTLTRAIAFVPTTGGTRVFFCLGINKMNNLKVFNFQGMAAIRFVESFPVANDVALALGYSKKSLASTINKKVFPQNRTLAKMATVTGEKETTVLKEAGIYQLIFSSKLELAQQFQQWVFEEVLPSIRKTGEYNLHKQIDNLTLQLEFMPSQSQIDKVLSVVEKAGYRGATFRTLITQCEVFTLHPYRFEEIIRACGLLRSPWDNRLNRFIKISKNE